MNGWPVAPSEDAFHGPAGEFVIRTAPHTEADPMALLIQFLVAFGVAAGRDAYWPIEASRHHPNEFAVLVGPSSKGRKGSAWDHVEAVLADADPAFAGDGLVTGLSSGEGLIAQVRDPVDSNDTDAPTDKRRLVVEAEFAQVMKVLAREGNTLSPVVRNAWDGKRLQTISRNSPLKATGAHIGIIGHITKDELLRYLAATELAPRPSSPMASSTDSSSSPSNARSCCRSAVSSPAKTSIMSASASSPRSVTPERNQP